MKIILEDNTGSVHTYDCPSNDLSMTKELLTVLEKNYGEGK